MQLLVSVIAYSGDRHRTHTSNTVIAPVLAAFTLAYKFGERQAHRKYVNEALVRHEQRKLTGEIGQFPDLKLIR